MARIIKVDGTSEEIENMSFADMQAAVGGYVAVINLPKGKILVVDEDGLPKQKPINVTASTIAGQMIVGDVVLANQGDIK